MHADDLFFQAFIYLAAAVLVVPISNRLGLGSVLGYLIAGVLIGPCGLHLVGRNGDDVMHFAEFGVVMMLFLVGLELQPSLLWRLRTPILGLGGLQVLATALVIALLALLLGQTPPVALAVGLILALVAALALLKASVLLVLGRLFRLAPGDNVLFALALAQGGEFAFVLFSFASANKVLPASLTSLLVVVVALSMLLTPLVLMAHERWLAPRLLARSPQRPADAIEPEAGAVIIAGFGRFGQIVGRLLLANRFPITVLDHSPTQIDLLRRFGWRVFYGDASRLDLLHAAGAERARLLVVAVDDADKSLEIVELARRHFPHLQVLARAFDRRHAYALIRLGVGVIRRETFGSALELGVDALQRLGVNPHRAHRAAHTFRRHDEAALREVAALEGDDADRIARSRQLSEELERLLQSDREDLGEERDRAWDISPLRAPEAP